MELTKNTPILDVSNLNAFYPVGKISLFSRAQKFQALFNISLVLNRGEITAVVGESGSGKSTLGKALVGLIPNLKGRFLFEGKQYNPLSMEKLREKIQIVFQDPYGSLNPRLKIGHALLEVVNYYPSTQDSDFRVKMLLQDVELSEDTFYRYPHELSGGQRQRVCIARALAVNPKIMVCDEIVSALDVSVQAKILNLILDLRNKHNLSILFTTHDLKIVKAFCDRVIVMHKGHIVEEGLVNKVFLSPKHSYTKILLSAGNIKNINDQFIQSN